MADSFYLQNQINFELNCLNRDHVYYLVDEQPEVCARLIAQGIEAEPELITVADLGEVFDLIEKTWETGRIAREEIYGHRVCVTVQSWDDVGPAIGLIRERQKDFKKRNNL